MRHGPRVLSDTDQKAPQAHVTKLVVSHTRICSCLILLNKQIELTSQAVSTVVKEKLMQHIYITLALPSFRLHGSLLKCRLYLKGQKKSLEIENFVF